MCHGGFESRKHEQLNGCSNSKFELEAKLTGSGGRFFSKPKRKLKRKSDADGGERLKVSVSDIDLPDGTEVTVQVGGNGVVRITWKRGHSS